MNINQESAEEIERFMLNNIEEEIDPGAETGEMKPISYWNKTHFAPYFLGID